MAADPLAALIFVGDCLVCVGALMSSSAFTSPAAVGGPGAMLFFLPPSSFGLDPIGPV